MVDLENGKAFMIFPMHLELKSAAAIPDYPLTVMPISLSYECVVALERPWVLLVALFTTGGIFPGAPLLRYQCSLQCLNSVLAWRVVLEGSLYNIPMLHKVPAPFSAFEIAGFLPFESGLTIYTVPFHVQFDFPGIFRNSPFTMVLISHSDEVAIGEESPRVLVLALFPCVRCFSTLPCLVYKGLGGVLFL